MVVQIETENTVYILRKTKERTLMIIRNAIRCNMLGGSKNNLSGVVDIAIMQSLISGDEVRDLVKDYGMVIVDECHHVSAVSFEQVLKEVNAKYVYGLTATPTRQDGHQPIIHMQCGPIRYQVDTKAQAEKRPFDHAVIPRFTSFAQPLTDETPWKITDAYAAMQANEERNGKIAADVLAATAEGTKLRLHPKTESSVWKNIGRSFPRTFAMPRRRCC